MKWVGLELDTATSLPRAEPHHAGGVVLQVDGQRRLHGAPSWNDGLDLQHPLDHAEGVVHRALDLVAHVVVGPAQNDGGRRPGFGAGGGNRTGAETRIRRRGASVRQTLTCSSRTSGRR